MRATRVLVGIVLAALAACGTRLPDSSFTRPVPAPSPDATATTATTPGVTSDRITIGNIVSKSNPFDARAFTGPYYGLRAFVDDINRQGGINGRKLIVRFCDDFGSATQNVKCVRQLIERDRVFALVSNGILDYAGASIVEKLGVPDIGSQPIDDAYTRYHHLWDVGGEAYPRDGTVGYDGKLHGGTETYRYFRATFPDVPRRAGVIYYNQSASRRYGQSIVTALRREGYSVVTDEVNFALPDYDSAVVKMKHAGVQFVYDAIDRGGNERLCKAMDDNRMHVTAKVTTTQNWNAGIRADYAQSPVCRNSIYATGDSANYDDVHDPQVARFRAAMDRLGWDTPDTMSEWALEGWAGAMWFADAVASCGADLTRTCVEAFMARPVQYTGRGLLLPRNFIPGDGAAEIHRGCLNVARWQDSANGGHGGWVTQVPDMNLNCFQVPTIVYRP